MIKAVLVFIQCDECKEIKEMSLQDIDVNEFFIELDKAKWWWRPVFVCPICQKSKDEPFKYLNDRKYNDLLSRMLRSLLKRGIK